ncbi:MAG: AraC family transcriptional regulator [Clostridia bacterium]|nr:AraC family transcriptional regulator [Clostridia bacterium]
MGLKVRAFSSGKQYPFWISMVGTSDCDKNYHITRDNSEIFCLEYVLDGQGYVSENGKSHVAVKGDAWFLKGGKNHEYYTDPDHPWKKIWMNFGGAVVGQLVEAYGLDEFYYPRTNIQPQLEEIHQVLANVENQKVAFDKCAVIFHRICQHLYDSRYSESNTQGTIAEEMKKYIDTHSETDVSLNDIIEHMHCSKAYAIRSFKKKYNITPYNYILLRKIEMAKNLLINTTTSINEISDYLGMCDSHYFSKYFKKHTGVSPSEYRRLQEISHRKPD